MANWGYFIGTVSVKWSTVDARTMKLISVVTYVDRFGYRWASYVGDVINGASVPWFFRRLFPAYIGRYRRATVLHDVACTERNRPSWRVHLMFFEAMRCDGVGPIQAWVLWAAVRAFGPRFPGKG